MKIFCVITPYLIPRELIKVSNTQIIVANKADSIPGCDGTHIVKDAVELRDYIAEKSVGIEETLYNAGKWNEELLKRLSIIEPQMQKLTSKDCIWRIYRDVRFSHDKRPYKEWFGSFPAIKGVPMKKFYLN